MLQNHWDSYMLYPMNHPTAALHSRDSAIQIVVRCPPDKDYAMSSGANCKVTRRRCLRLLLQERTTLLPASHRWCLQIGR